MNIEKTKMREN